MKKLIIAVAIVCAAVAAQAASLSWGSSKFYWDPTTNQKATSITGGDVVLCLINDGIDWTKGVTVLDEGVLTSTTMASTTGKIQGSEGGAFVWTFADGTVENGDVLTVLFKDSSGNLSQLAYVDATTGQPTTSLVTDTYTVSGLSNDTSTLTKFTFGASGNIAAQAVPEPTSGLLLLLGVAGLALKRRRA